MSHPTPAQYGQDRFLDEQVFGGKRGGTFVEVGAFDGVTLSNTWFFEKQRGWSGICVEPSPRVFARLQSERDCICVCAAVGQSEGTAAFLVVEGELGVLSGIVSRYHRKHRKRVKSETEGADAATETIEVPTVTLDTLFSENGIESIDYLSIDTEGGELGILRSIPARVAVEVVGVEDNYGDPRIGSLMRKRGYEQVAKMGCDLIFRKFR